MAGSSSHPFLDPLWRRVVLIGACAVWFVLELLYGDPMWTWIAGGFTAYGACVYLYSYKATTLQAGDKS